MPDWRLFGGNSGENIEYTDEDQLKNSFFCCLVLPFAPAAGALFSGSFNPTPSPLLYGLFESTQRMTIFGVGRGIYHI